MLGGASRMGPSLSGFVVAFRQEMAYTNASEAQRGEQDGIEGASSWPFSRIVNIPK